MARNRIIKPDFWDDEKLCKISRDARLTFIGMWNNSDDYGVVKGHPGWLKSRIFPYDDDLSINNFETWLQSLEDIHVIIPFMAHGEKYYFIVNFLRHQAIDKPSKTRNPEPPKNILDEYSTRARRVLEDEVKYKYKYNTTPPTPPRGGGEGGEEIAGNSTESEKTESIGSGKTTQPGRNLRSGILPKSLQSLDVKEKTASNSTSEKTELIDDGKITQPGKKLRPKILPKSLQSLFECFWKAYPRKQNKGTAEKAFLAIMPDEQLLATMLATIERAKKSDQWQRDNGQYIPYPASWLNAKGWQDEYPDSRPDEDSEERIGRENTAKLLKRLRSVSDASKID